MLSFKQRAAVSLPIHSQFRDGFPSLYQSARVVGARVQNGVRPRARGEVAAANDKGEPQTPTPKARDDDAEADLYDF